MKQIWNCLFLLLSASASAQVTLEHTYNIQFGNQMFYTDLGNNNYKYCTVDFYNDKFSLYNLDHSPFMLNISTAISLQSGVFWVGYITTTLFDCDSSNIEYVLTSTASSTLPFYVYRTDGTLLFQKDSVVTQWCFGCFGGISIHPIYNTPMGTKLLLANQSAEEWYVYSLCGSLPVSIDEIEQDGNHYVHVYPNPSSGNTVLEINSPGNIENYELTIYDASFQSVRKESVKGIQKITLENDKLSSGAYYFSLQTKNKIIQTGKFIISK